MMMRVHNQIVYYRKKHTMTETSCKAGLTALSHLEASPSRIHFKFTWYPVNHRHNSIRSDICNFSTHTKFLDKFFSTQKCVNYNKTDFATKCVNFDKTDFFQENIINFACMATFFTSHTYQMFRISDFSTSVMGRHLKFFISLQSSYTESWKFSTWQFFLHIYNLWYLWQISGLPIVYKHRHSFKKQNMQ